MAEMAGFGIGDGLADATLRCIARKGVAKTTLEDVARESGSSRATVYRGLPGGGKDALLSAVAQREVDAMARAVSAAVEAATDIEDALVAAVTTAARHLEAHAAFRYIVAHEPGRVLPHLAFHRLDALLVRIRAAGEPLLARHLGAGSETEAGELAEWVARVVISYTFSPAAGIRLTDETSVLRLVRSFVLPGLRTPVVT